MVVVAEELILRRRLGRRRLERGMRIDHALRDLPPRPGNAPLADAAVVARDVLHQPVDRVPGVGAFVGARRALYDRQMMDELSLRFELPARVLVDEDVALPGELVVRTEYRAV